VSERFWDRVLQRLEEETLVPILGPDLLAVGERERSLQPERGASEASREARAVGAGPQGSDRSLLYPLLAKSLARHLGVSAEDLPAGSELSEVSRRYLAKSKDSQEIYRSLRVVLREIEPIPIPEPLHLLARISKLDLFVTTTFDVLMERAVDHQRFDGQRQTLAFAYAPSDRQDLPPEFGRLGRPAVFHLLGRLSGTPHSFAVTREDTLEFQESLQRRPPGFLFDKLRQSDLLILGSPLSSWLTRLLAQGLPEQDAPALFVERASGTIETAPVKNAIGFVEELHGRWIELSFEDHLGPAASIPTGAVLLSAVEADRSAAESLRAALDRAGIDVVLDLDDTPLEPRKEKRLRAALSRLAAFAPLISETSARSPRRFLRPEWVEAILEAGRTAPSGRFVLPVAIDDSPRGEMPEGFGELIWEKLPGGEPSSEFVKTLVEIQRRYRRAKSA
jgi:hypothetical protein